MCINIGLDILPSKQSYWPLGLTVYTKWHHSHLAVYPEGYYLNKQWEGEWLLKINTWRCALALGFCTYWERITFMELVVQCCLQCLLKMLYLWSICKASSLIKKQSNIKKHDSHFNKTPSLHHQSNTVPQQLLQNRPIIIQKNGKIFNYKINANVMARPIWQLCHI